MAGYEQRDNSGTLFKNDKKTSEKHPDYKGSAMINGEEFWMSAWLKVGKNSVKFMSFAFEPKDSQGGGKSKKEEESDESDMPF
jgi:hypothetical protein